MAGLGSAWHGEAWQGKARFLPMKRIEITTTKYVWKEGARVTQLNAQACGERMEDLRTRRRGVLSEEDVVKDSRAATSPFHKAIEWNDKKAAHEHRLYQARGIIRSIRVVVESQGTGDDPEPQRLYVHVQPDTEDEDPREPGYVTLEDVKANPRLEKQVLEEAYALLLGIRARFRELKELRLIFKEIDRLGERLTKRRKKEPAAAGSNV